MKKTFLTISLVLAILGAACQRQLEPETSNSPVFIATIDNSEYSSEQKTSINTSTWKVSWKITDEITVKDASDNEAVYAIESIGKNGRATFVKKSGQPDLGVGPYTATYGKLPPKEQPYTTVVEDLYMEAPATTTNSFQFSVRYGLLKFVLTRAGESVQAITVTGKDATNSKLKYSIYFPGDPVSIATTHIFYLVLPQGTYSEYYFEGTDCRTCYLTDPVGTTVTPGHVTPVALSGKLVFDYNFSVSDTKRVRFTKGNLYWDGSKWQMEKRQYDYRTWQGNKSCIDGVISSNGTPAGHVGLMYWTRNAADSYKKDYCGEINTESDVAFFAESKGGLTVGEQTKLYAMSFPEADYLVNKRSSGKFKRMVTVCGNPRCWIITPDGFRGEILKSYDEAAWATVEKKGFICLPWPNCDFRHSDELNEAHDNILYHTSTSAGVVAGQHKYGSYYSIPHSIRYQGSCEEGICLRLVYNTKTF